MSPYFWRKHIAKMSIEDLSKKTGLSSSYISKIENAKAGSIASFQKLKDISGNKITIEGFLAGKDFELQQEAPPCAPA